MARAPGAHLALLLLLLLLLLVQLFTVLAGQGAPVLEEERQAG
jgi:hypothetical protein